MKAGWYIKKSPYLDIYFFSENRCITDIGTEGYFTFDSYDDAENKFYMNTDLDEIKTLNRVLVNNLFLKGFKYD